MKTSLSLAAVLLTCACSSGDPPKSGSGGGGEGATSTASSTGGAGGGAEGCVPHLVAKGATLPCNASGCGQLHDGPPEGPDWCADGCDDDSHCFGEATCYFDQSFNIGVCALPCDAGACEAPLTCAEDRCVMNP